jgi:hypothetical protein
MELAKTFSETGGFRDSIIMINLKEENYRNGFQEYLWMVLNRSAGALRYWLKMGIAEIYSDLWSSGYSGGASFYHSGTGRDAGLDLSVLLAAKGSGRPGVTLGGGSISQHANYSRDAAWLVRLLMFGADYAPKFAALVEELASGKEPAGVFQDLYGRSVGQVQADYRSVLSYSNWGMTFSYKRKYSGPMDIRPATPFQSGVMLADLLVYVPYGEGKSKEAYLELGCKETSVLRLRDAAAR